MFKNSSYWETLNKKQKGKGKVTRIRKRRNGKEEINPSQAQKRKEYENTFYLLNVK